MSQQINETDRRRTRSCHQRSRICIKKECTEEDRRKRKLVDFRRKWVQWRESSPNSSAWWLDNLEGKNNAATNNQLQKWSKDFKPERLKLLTGKVGKTFCCLTAIHAYYSHSIKQRDPRTPVSGVFTSCLNFLFPVFFSGWCQDLLIRRDCRSHCHLAPPRHSIPSTECPLKVSPLLLRHWQRLWKAVPIYKIPCHFLL